MRKSRTEIAVLGGLSVEPMSGYALRNAIAETLGHFWSESYGQIYPTLARLESAGLVHRLEGGRASSSRYEITASGLDRLRDLLREPHDESPPRNGLLLRLFFGRLLGPEICLELIESAASAARRELETYEAIDVVLRQSTDPNADYFLVTLLAGRHHAAAQLAWAEDAADLLRRRIELESATASDGGIDRG